MTSPAGNTEPTAEQWELADELIDQLHSASTSSEQLNMVARALAAAVTAEREKWAQRVQDVAVKAGMAVHAEWQQRWDEREAEFARRIREVTG